MRSSYKAGEVFLKAILEARDAERPGGSLAGGVEAEATPMAAPRSVRWTPEQAEGRAARVLGGAA